MALHFVIIFLAFTTLWLASELIISSMTKLVKRLKISAFSASFFILGILTSIPEFSIGLNSVIEKKPMIFVGNLIGASVVLFILIIPLLAVIGNGIKVTHQLPDRHLVYTLIVVLLPTLFTLNGSINRIEALVMIILYVFLFYLLEKKRGLIEMVSQKLDQQNYFRPIDGLKVAFGALCVFIASHSLVESMLPVANFIGLHPFIISLLLISIGTNLPEIFLGIMAIVKKQKDIAFGDYVGSAAANTFLFGLLTIIHGSVKLNGDEYALTFGIFTIGLIAFYFFVRSKQEISRWEGIILLFIYSFFVSSELIFR